MNTTKTTIRDTEFLIQHITARYIAQSPEYISIYNDYLVRLDIARRMDYWENK